MHVDYWQHFRFERFERKRIYVCREQETTLKAVVVNAVACITLCVISKVQMHVSMSKVVMVPLLPIRLQATPRRLKPNEARSISAARWG